VGVVSREMIDSDERQADKERAAGFPPPPVESQDYAKTTAARSRRKSPGVRRERGYRLSRRRIFVSMRLVRLEAPRV
jgi:hypothetical protein